jgi:hypothetical protein
MLLAIISFTSISTGTSKIYGTAGGGKLRLAGQILGGVIRPTPSRRSRTGGYNQRKDSFNKL